jgi:uncharacterized phage protein (TIGR01671 family)|nr:MAG TPA: YopX protein [Caudoviricetes sp.]
MREILFKVKQKDSGEWIGCICVCADERIYIAYTFEFGDILAISAQIPEIYPGTICQYTGLSDKNGQRIWENDICAVVSADEDDEIFVVRWSEEMARFVLEGDSLVLDFDNVYGTECEVIGNVFDDPELMEGETDDRE